MLATNFVFIETADTRIRFSSVGVDNNLGNRAFSAAGPRVWNDLPTDLRQPDLSYSRFTQSPKTFFCSAWTKRSVNPPLTALQKSSYFLTLAPAATLTQTSFAEGEG